MYGALIKGDTRDHVTNHTCFCSHVAFSDQLSYNNIAFRAAISRCRCRSPISLHRVNLIDHIRHTRIAAVHFGMSPYSLLSYGLRRNSVALRTIISLALQMNRSIPIPWLANDPAQCSARSSQLLQLQLRHL